MSDYLNNLIARSFNQVEVIQPRLASLFEPLSSHAGLDATPDISWEQPNMNRDRGKRELSQVKRNISIDDSDESAMMFDWETLIDVEKQGFQALKSPEVSQTEIELPIINKSASVSPAKIPAPNTHRNQLLQQTNTEDDLTLVEQTESFAIDSPQDESKISRNTVLNPIPNPKSEQHHTVEIEAAQFKSEEFDQNFSQHQPVFGSQQDLTSLKPEQISINKLAATYQANANTFQLKEERSVEAKDQLQQKKVSSDILPLKPLVRNPISREQPTKPANILQPQVQPSTSTKSVTTEVSPPTPTINISIGRIEVRATPPTVSPPTKQQPATPVMGLEQYLHQRAKGDYR